MQFESTKSIGDIRISDVGRAVFNFFSLAVVMKAAFIILSAVLLTVIVTHPGTSYTPTVDVFAYSLVYSSWITICLPWLVQNMNGKLLGMMIGVVFRLFAVDVGVLAWSAIRGHRNILQRGLRFRPIFEPSMSWLAEAGYNLRYGVIVSAIVASAISLMIDYYDKVSKERKTRKGFHLPKRGNTWLPSAALRASDAIYSDRNIFHQCQGHDREYSSHYQESRNPKFGPSSQFDINDGCDANPLSKMDIADKVKREHTDNKRWLTVLTSDTDNYDDSVHREMRDQEIYGPQRNDNPTILQSYKSTWNDTGDFRKSNVLETSEFPRVDAVFPDSCRFENEDRICEADLDETASVYIGKSSKKRAESTSRIEIDRGKPTVGRLREGCARRDYTSNTATNNDKQQSGRRRRDPDAIVNALNDSFNELRKMRGKI